MIIAIITIIASIFQVANSGYAAGVGHNNAGWVGVIMYIINLIVSIMLLIGVRKEKRNFLMIWVWFSIICLVINLIAGGLGVLGGSFELLITAIISAIITGYCVVVVRSYAFTLGGGVGSPA